MFSYDPKNSVRWVEACLLLNFCLYKIYWIIIFSLIMSRELHRKVI